MRADTASAIVRIDPPANMPLTCLIVDDNARFREEARALLEEQGIEVVGAVASSNEAVEQAIGLAPDIALVDIDLGGESGLDLASRLRSDAVGPLQVILISIHDESEYADLIAASAAVGFVAKTDLSAQAIACVLASAGGETV